MEETDEADRPHLRESPYRRILFCTDFSENADFAFDFAIDAAQRRPGSTLYLLHVIPEPEAQFWKTYLYEVDGIDAKARRDIDAKLEETYLPRVPAGVDLQVEMKVGKDYIKILEFAREKTVDLIIIGRAGRGGLRKALFGNVTEKVARKADCAVLVVPLSYSERATE
ncbi:MAG: universal stress protein [Planctomycetes bacterium]|nr:universal stress protein [Planctomycetota bacterium]